MKIVTGTVHQRQPLATDRNGISREHLGASPIRIWYGEMQNGPVYVNTVDQSQVLVTTPTIIFDGVTRVCLEFFSPYVHQGIVIINFWDNSSDLYDSTATSEYERGGNPCHKIKYLTPTFGKHVFSVRAYYNSTPGYVEGGANGYVPAFLLVRAA